MFLIFREEKLISICMLVLFLLSLCFRLVLGFFYRHLIRETDNMAATDNKILKQCKLKFTNCFQLNQGVSNIPVFVDKFLNRLAIGPFSFELIYHLSGQLMLLSVVCSGIGICKSIAGGRLLLEIFPFYIVSFLSLYLYFAVSALLDIKGMKQSLKTELVDYLENHLASRISVTGKDMEELFGTQQQVPPAFSPASSSASSSASPAARSARKSARASAGVSAGAASAQLRSSRLQARDTVSAAKQQQPDSSAPAASRAAKNLTPEQVHELEDLLAEFLTP